MDRNAYGLENRTWNRRASSASTDTNSSNTGLNTLAGTFGSTIFRIVKTASADVTGFPSSQAASSRSVIVYASPSDETSIPCASPGTSASFASKSNRLRWTYWSTCASGALDCSTALSVVGSPKSRRCSTPPSTGVPCPDSSMNPSVGGAGRGAGVDTGARAATAGSGFARHAAPSRANPSATAARPRFMLTRLCSETREPKPGT